MSSRLLFGALLAGLDAGIRLAAGPGLTFRIVLVVLVHGFGQLLSMFEFGLGGVGVFQDLFHLGDDFAERGIRHTNAVGSYNSHAGSDSNSYAHPRAGGGWNPNAHHNPHADAAGDSDSDTHPSAHSAANADDTSGNAVQPEGLRRELAA